MRTPPSAGDPAPEASSYRQSELNELMLDGMLSRGCRPNLYGMGNQLFIDFRGLDHDPVADLDIGLLTGLLSACVRCLRIESTRRRKAASAPTATWRSGAISTAASTLHQHLRAAALMSSVGFVLSELFRKI